MPWASKRRDRTGRNQDEVVTPCDVRDYATLQTIRRQTSRRRR